jgi:hypothetical protein
MNNELKATFTTGPESHLGIELRSKAMDLESGWLGKAFGNHTNAPTNIAGFVAVCLIVAGTGMVGLAGWEKSSEFWKVISPLLTLVLGYLFGKNS